MTRSAPIVDRLRKASVNSIRRSVWTALVAVGAVLVLGACQEDLAGGASCPSLCPQPNITPKDTVLVGDAMLDTAATVRGFPRLGNEGLIQIARFRSTDGADSVMTAGVFRFDTLRSTFVQTDTTKPPVAFASIDSAYLQLSVFAPGGADSVPAPPDTLTFTVYDVDTPAADLDTAAIRPKFGATPLATLRVSPDSLHKASPTAIRIFLDTAWVGARVRGDGGNHRIRLGVTVNSVKGAAVDVGSVESGVQTSANLSYKGIRDTQTVRADNHPATFVRVGPPLPLSDYEFVLVGNSPPPPGFVAVGGIPGSRLLLRFALPPEIVDTSSTIVRANLLLTRLRDSTFTSTDSLVIAPQLLRATPEVTDLSQAAALVTPMTSVGLSSRSLVLHPERAGVDTISLVGVLRFWHNEGTGKFQRGIVLQTSPSEGLDPRQILYYGPDAANAANRPRLQLTYIPPSGFGLP